MEQNNYKEKQSRVREMFNAIAPTYDRLNHLLSLGIDRRWRKRVVKMVEKMQPQRIADIATGTGDLAIVMAKRMPHVQVVGIDPSEQMLEVGRTKVEKAGLQGQISMQVGSAEALAEQFGAEFDVATVAFGARNFGDVQLGLSQMGEIVRKGGHIVVLEFSKPNNRLFGALYNFYFHKVLPLVGGWISGNRQAYQYLPSSVEEFASPQQVVEMLQRAGFESCSVQSLTFGVARIYSGVKK